jgi:hypothetical protein
MNILFVENRNKTILYENIIKYFSDSDLKIFWIVFNKSFIPSAGNTYIIGKSAERTKRIFSESVNKILSADRGTNYFEVKSNYHFFNVQTELNDILNIIKPDLIFGEATSFHEQMIINWARQNSIVYLHPNSNRYPPYRFSFYLYDTLKPFEGSGEKIQGQNAEELIAKINSGSLKPDYMNMISISAIEKIKYYSKIIRSNISGEKYLTPSIDRKLRLDLTKKKVIKEWDNNSFEDFKKEEGLFYILYPMQMQPEMNIEYWGYPYSNQVKLIQYIAENTDNNIRVLVKPNPKSKYEMTKELFEFCNKNYKVIPLAHSVKMGDIIDNCDLIFTNTGTVSYEAYLRDVPVFVIGNFNNNFIKQKKLEELNDTINMVINKSYEFATVDKKIEFLNYLLSNSYKGIIGDVYLNKGILSESNLKLLAYAFYSVIEKLKVKKITLD